MRRRVAWRTRSSRSVSTSLHGRLKCRRVRGREVGIATGIADAVVPDGCLRQGHLSRRKGGPQPAIPDQFGARHEFDGANLGPWEAARPASLAGEVQGVPYLAMELIEGETLQALVRRAGEQAPADLPQRRRQAEQFAVAVGWR